MSFLNLSGKTVLVLGVSNKRSVGWAVAQALLDEGAIPILGVHRPARVAEVESFAKGCRIVVCDVENESDIESLGTRFSQDGIALDGLVHSIAYARYEHSGMRFHETSRKDFLQAIQISAFSLVEVARHLKPVLNPSASVVTIGISSTQVTAENYGYMAPIKAALGTMVRYLAKSFSRDTAIRFNSVDAGPLKTRASAGIPGYLKNYLYAEQLTFRKRALEVQEVASTVLFLLSERSSGINGQGIVVNAGMDLNYFDADIVDRVTAIQP